MSSSERANKRFYSLLADKVNEVYGDGTVETFAISWCNSTPDGINFFTRSKNTEFAMGIAAKLWTVNNTLFDVDLIKKATVYYSDISYCYVVRFETDVDLLFNFFNKLDRKEEK